MDINNPIISVIIPIYNAEKHLRQCLDSVLQQSVRDIEVICVDDGSTDMSPRILEEYRSHDTRIKVVTQKNSYAGMARNAGIKLATGRYIAFLDSDDFYWPNALKRLYLSAERKSADIVKGSYNMLDSKSGKYSSSAYTKNKCAPHNRVISFRKCPTCLLKTTDSPCNGIYRREFLVKNKILFNNLVCVNDHSFYIQCLLRAERVVLIRHTINCYRVAQEGSLIGQKAKNFQSQFDNYRIVQELSKDEPLEYRQVILQQELHSLLYWYQRLRPDTADPLTFDIQVKSFLQGIDENEIGEAFLKSFSFHEIYHTLRYGSQPEKKGKVY